MKPFVSCLTLLFGLLTAVACQSPDEVENDQVREITRVVEVEVTRLVDAPASTSDAAPAASVVVTRVVTEVREVPVTGELPPLGSEERPIQIWSAPSVAADIGDARAAILTRALADATGYAVDVRLAASDEEAIEGLCANSSGAMAILTAGDFVTAAGACEAQAGLAAVRFGHPWHTGMIVVQQDSGISSLADLAGKSWGVADVDSISTSRYFQALLDEAGVEVGDIVEFTSETEVMLAFYRGEVDFATATFIPPVLPFDERPWEYGEDDPEMWRGFAGFMPERHPLGYIVVAGLPENGGYRVRDARAAVYDVEREIFNETEILQLSAPIPNDTVAFGAGFPLGTARQVMRMLAEFAASNACAQTFCARDFYDWMGLEPVDEAFYEPVPEA